MKNICDWLLRYLQVILFTMHEKDTASILSNLRVAQNGRFAINPVYPGGGTMVAKISDFRLFENLQNALFRTFFSPKISLESWILHCLCKNFPKYPSDITIRISTIAYHSTFHCLKYTKYWFLKSLPAVLLLVSKQ